MTMSEEDLRTFFLSHLKDPMVSPSLAALRTLMEFVQRDDSKTLQGFSVNLNSAKEVLQKIDTSSTSVQSAAELFLCFITLTSLEQPDFEECRKILSERGRIFLNQVDQARPKIAELGATFITRLEHKILTHSRSRVVYQTLLRAYELGKQFHVFVTRASPGNDGKEMVEWLSKAGISCTLIEDSAVGYYMEMVDFVFVGAEGITQNGGIINKVGTLSLAICAKVQRKPFYVLAECVKFIRVFPFSQTDLSESLKSPVTKRTGMSDLSPDHPIVDYTYPELITLIITDLGALTSAAVCEEFLKLYY